MAINKNYISYFVFILSSQHINRRKHVNIIKNGKKKKGIKDPQPVFMTFLTASLEAFPVNN